MALYQFSYSLRQKSLAIFVVSKIEKYKIIAFGRDFGKSNFSDNPGQKEGAKLVCRKTLFCEGILHM